MKVIILSGVSGSGKSSLAVGILLSSFKEDDVVICSSNDYFTNSFGAYSFFAGGLNVAHERCMRKFIDALRGNVSIVVVDNSNTTALEIAPYYLVAKAFKANVKIVTVSCDPDTAFTRNKHGISHGVILAQHANLRERYLPIDWEYQSATIIH